MYVLTRAEDSRIYEFNNTEPRKLVFTNLNVFTVLQSD